MSRRRRGARLEMTSLMDVMFLVLVFFIYCIFDMAVHRGVKVDLPRAAGAEERGERLVVTIRADDSLQLNGMDVEKPALLAKVAALQAAGMHLPVLIAADRKASLGNGLELLADLKARGIEKVSFQVAGREP
ncbi:MAG TPA: hypothetical protein DDY72_01720 [Verrucomicrobia bacterium]|nr:hypothetical protein [Verrucomicrobiota bacterium]